MEELAAVSECACRMIEEADGLASGAPAGVVVGSAAALVETAARRPGPRWREACARVGGHLVEVNLVTTEEDERVVAARRLVPRTVSATRRALTAGA